MNLNKAFSNELQFEGASTRKMLERLPFDQADWKPHAKSTTLLNLAKHIARLPQWVEKIMLHDDVDVSKSPFPPYPELHSAAELVAYQTEVLAEAQKALDQSSDEEFMKPFTMRAGDKVIFTMPKAAALRSMGFNHLVHHRGQLSVYLRLLEVPVPGMYGLSADEK